MLARIDPLEMMALEAAAQQGDPQAFARLAMQAAAPQEPDAPLVSGGQYHTSESGWQDIPGYMEDQLRLREASRGPGVEPISYSDPINDPNLGWIQRDSRGHSLTDQNAPAKLTPPQEANNAEIDAARERLMATGFSREDLRRLTLRQDETGLPNEEYDPALAKLIGLAGSRKVGEDAEFQMWSDRLYGTTPPPPPTGPGAGAAAGQSLQRGQTNGRGARMLDGGDGQQVEVIGEMPDGSLRVRDPRTGRTGRLVP
jgi:hypothetical protein